MAITVKARHPALGAEVRGVDMRLPMDAETLKAVNDAWMNHLVLVFPEQRITDREHVNFTRNFGEAEIFHQTSLHLRSERVAEIFLVSNVDESGRLMRPSNPTQKQLSSSQRWHTDSSYRAMPSMGALLHGIDKAISETLSIPARVAEDPLTAVARGTGVFLDKLDVFSKVLSSDEDD